jgi:hypothetical protein
VLEDKGMGDEEGRNEAEKGRVKLEALFTGDN